MQKIKVSRLHLYRRVGLSSVYTIIYSSSPKQQQYLKTFTVNVQLTKRLSKQGEEDQQ